MSLQQAVCWGTFKHTMWGLYLHMNHIMCPCNEHTKVRVDTCETFTSEMMVGWMRASGSVLVGLCRSANMMLGVCL